MRKYKKSKLENILFMFVTILAIQFIFCLLTPICFEIADGFGILSLMLNIGIIWLFVVSNDFEAKRRK